MVVTVEIVCCSIGCLLSAEHGRFTARPRRNRVRRGTSNARRARGDGKRTTRRENNTQYDAHAPTQRRRYADYGVLLLRSEPPSGRGGVDVRFRFTFTVRTQCVRARARPAVTASSTSTGGGAGGGGGDDDDERFPPPGRQVAFPRRPVARRQR